MGAVQATFDELGTPLREVTFVVVDLETTGGSPQASAITEIGAVKVRGGEVLGEFQTLVNPGAAIPPFISVLTGITDGMVAGSPRIEAALPAFLEFAQGSVLVAHNAPFDLGFLRHQCGLLGFRWPDFDHLDTALLARRVLTRDEAPDCRLSTLARVLRARTTPIHRALADARATTDVLHTLMERLGNIGVQSLEELATFRHLVPPEQRRKRHLADGLPHLPGVYLFRDEQGRVLYVGKSRDLRARVRNYFVASEPRTRMAEMVRLAERVDAVVCTSEVEAEVRELRLIAEHQPRYNRRSRRSHRAVFVKLTVELFPRLSVVRTVQLDGALYLGPFSSPRGAELTVAAVHEAIRLRQCTPRITRSSRTPPCVLYEMGRCGAPCDGTESVDDYAVHVEAYRTALLADVTGVVEAARARMAVLAEQRRFEDAALCRDRMGAFVRAVARTQRLTALASCAEIVAARPTDRGWELAVVRHGRLAAAGRAGPAESVRAAIDALVLTAEPVPAGPGPTPNATAEEMGVILRWLEQPGVRLVSVTGTWAMPARGAGAHLGWLAAAESGAQRVEPFADRRHVRPVHQPARGFA